MNIQKRLTNKKLNVWTTSGCFHPSVYSSICIRSSVYSSICLFLHLSIHPSVWKSFCLFFHLLFVHVSLHRSICHHLNIYRSIKETAGGTCIHFRLHTHVRIGNTYQHMVCFLTVSAVLSSTVSLLICLF